MSNLTPKMNQTSIEINGNLHFTQILDGESFWNFTNCPKCENEYLFNEITLLLSIIYSFIKFKSP